MLQGQECMGRTILLLPGAKIVQVGSLGVSGAAGRVTEASRLVHRGGLRNRRGQLTGSSQNLRWARAHDGYVCQDPEWRRAQSKADFFCRAM
jgi:hypothetical protein